MDEQLLEMLKEFVTSLSNVISNLAPQVWEIYYKQQIISGVEMIVAGLLLLWLAYYLRSIFKKDDTFDDFDVGMFTVIDVVFFGGLAAVLLATGFEKLLNPSYFVLQDLIKTIK